MAKHSTARILQSSQKIACCFLHEFFSIIGCDLLYVDVTVFSGDCPGTAVIPARNNLDSVCEVKVPRNYSIVNFLYRN
jgi:hypothetical protein